MADITMCNGNGCPKKESCYRFTATANPWRQSYFCAPPVENGECEHFWPDEDYKEGKKEVDKT